jgi:hemerythrin-like domain-containing protein
MKKSGKMKKKTAKVVRLKVTESKNKPRAQGSAFAEGAQKITSIFEGLFSSRPKDIVDAIKIDHEALRNFLKILKDTDADMKIRRSAYAQFAALLKSHSHSEEQALYVPSDKLPGRDMHIKIAEGYVEHQVGTDIMQRIERAKNPVTWSAHANVLSETIEHHLAEEERDLLPLVRKTASPSLNASMLEKYLKLRAASQRKRTPKNSGVLDKSLQPSL